jgi:outer membrane protein assembly factor BamB
MNTDDILLLGLKGKVAAIAKRTGQPIWETEVTGGIGDRFVTVLSDGQYVFAYTAGHLHCLDLRNGQVLWTNGLRGYGYGIASLALVNGAAAPELTAVQTHMLRQRQATPSAT